MINLARQRNHGHVVAGKARLEAVALEEAAFGGARFTKVFAFNVNLFERRPAHALDVIRSLLLPRGGVYLYIGP